MLVLLGITALNPLGILSCLLLSIISASINSFAFSSVFLLVVTISVLAKKLLESNRNILEVCISLFT